MHTLGSRCQSQYPNPDKYSFAASSILLLLPNLHSISISLDITDHILPHILTPPGRDPQNQIVQTLPAEDIHVIARIGTASGREAFRLMRHLVDVDLDACRVVAVHVPALVAHVADGQQINGPIAFT